MNSYSRQTLRGGYHKTANGPYGAHRGNSVMHAKRTSGPSAQSVVCARHTRDLAAEHARLASIPDSFTRQPLKDYGHGGFQPWL